MQDWLLCFKVKNAAVCGYVLVRAETAELAIEKFKSKQDPAAATSFEDVFSATVE